jgi:murein DD-endopeptidase MepM/ murein hydrolase activator NlpD
VERGGKTPYPGPVKFDTTGRPVADSGPETAGGPEGGPARAYAQVHDGETVRVAGHERAPPRSSDGAEDGKTSRGLPPMRPPVVKPRVRGTDGYGGGWYGAPRQSGPHKGVDIVAAPGETVRSPVLGRIEIRPSDNGVYNNGSWIEPYPDDVQKRGKLKGVGILTDDGHRVRVLYVDPDAVGLRPGQRVEIGDPIGAAQNLSMVYRPKPGGAMTNHIHVDVKKDGEFKDPTAVLLGR